MIDIANTSILYLYSAEYICLCFNWSKQIITLGKTVKLIEVDLFTRYSFADQCNIAWYFSTVCSAVWSQYHPVHEHRQRVCVECTLCTECGCSSHPQLTGVWKVSFMLL